MSCEGCQKRKLELAEKELYEKEWILKRTIEINQRIILEREIKIIKEEIDKLT